MKTKLTLPFAFWGIMVFGNAALYALLNYIPSMSSSQLFWGHCIIILYGFASGITVWFSANKFYGEIIYRDLSKIMVVFLFWLNFYLIYSLYDPKHVLLHEFLDKYYK